ncbi:MAG TPA: hypothetical protein PK890_09220 [Terrimesophilobacter sp.]|nr:hypothetical protein [Terrimesophilobacter sp.]
MTDVILFHHALGLTDGTQPSYRPEAARLLMGRTLEFPSTVG